MDIEPSHSGLITVKWSVEIHNLCDSSYDGTLRVKFFIDDSIVPQETVDFIILSARESKKTDGTINLPVEGLSEIRRTEVEIEERERPL
jgi:hypothetical protein